MSINTFYADNPHPLTMLQPPSLPSTSNGLCPFHAACLRPDWTFLCRHVHRNALAIVHFSLGDILEEEEEETIQEPEPLQHRPYPFRRAVSLEHHRPGLSPVPSWRGSQLVEDRSSIPLRVPPKLKKTTAEFDDDGVPLEPIRRQSTGCAYDCEYSGSVTHITYSYYGDENGSPGSSLSSPDSASGRPWSPPDCLGVLMPSRPWNDPNMVPAAEPGSLRWQLASSVGTQLWVRPERWTDAHLRLFGCIFRDVGPRTGEEQQRQQQKGWGFPVVVRSCSRSPHRWPGLISGSLDWSVRLNWYKARALAVSGTPASEERYAQLLWPVGDHRNGRRRRAMLERILRKATGLDFFCRERLVSLMIAGQREADPRVILCALNYHDKTFGRRGFYSQKPPNGGRPSVSSSSLSLSLFSRAPMSSWPRLFPAAVYVGKESKAVTLLRALSLGFVDLDLIRRRRLHIFPYWIFEAKGDTAFGARLRRGHEAVEPKVRLEDPYLLSAMIAMAQHQDVWRDCLTDEERLVMCRHGEGWLCRGGFKVRLIGLDDFDTSGLWIYSATIPQSLIKLLRFPEKSPYSSECSTAEEDGTNNVDDDLDLDGVVIQYRKVSFAPAVSFPERLGKTLVNM